MTIKGFIIWFICALFFLYEFFLRTVLGIFQVQLMNDLDLSALQFAMVSSTSYQIIYGFMQLPVGILADRYGLKKSLLFATLTCSLATLGFACSQGYATALLYRFFMGLGSSFGFVCLLLAVYDWLPRKNIALFIGLSQFIGTMGPMLASGPLSTTLESHSCSWRGLFFALACIGSGLALLVVYFIEKNREHNHSFFILSRQSSFWINFKQLIRQKQIWYIGFYSASVYFSLEYLSENEGISFLKAKGFSGGFSAYLISIAWLGYAVGCPVSGYLSDKYQQRKPLMFCSVSLVLLSLIAIIYLPLSQLASLTFFFTLGLGASGQSIGFAIISEYCKASYLTIGLAFNNTVIMFYGAFSAPLLGWFLEKKPPHVSLLFHYQENFSLIITLVLSGFILSSLFIKETFCKQAHETTFLQLKSSP